MLTLEEILLVSADRVASCRVEVQLDLDEVIARFENVGFSRKEVLFAMSELIGEKFAALPDMPKLH
ncbi:hypothetical protein [Rhizobium sp. Root1220]|uniref:hypothetical protein n=1 Tax=Rhizobium sp. Root1220 TaxID=1736432 RepID=UPI0006FC696E|nr:hypothetical protein [Rhizobium sp. Root1220]KQV66312.1 hypothetical protein ASC90_14110 [Rhizobium sp. Root1220]